MNFLFAGTAIVWLAILGYMISFAVRQKKLIKRINDLEQRVKNLNGDRFS
ncbi:hypothetical protein BSNK01_23760 [Bacillaceae bacterium]